MRSKTLKQLIVRSRGVEEAIMFSDYRLTNPQLVLESARDIMSNVQPYFGACAMLSSAWAGYLQDNHSIPAIVVAGDLKISGKKVFRCKKNLPEPTKAGKLLTGNWDGHCWIEIDGYIGDLSIFRTAYAIEGASMLKEFIVSNFGLGRGAILSPVKDLPTGMQYLPKFVLKDNQINGLIAGMMYQLDKGI